MKHYFLAIGIGLLLLLGCSNPNLPPTPIQSGIVTVEPSTGGDGPGYPVGDGYPSPNDGAIERNTQWPLFDGTLLFHSGRLNDISLFGLSGADGTYTKLELPTNAFEPDYNHNCSQIAFTGDVGGRYAIYTANADGSNAQPILQSADGDVYGAAWSPDGTQIAYMVLENANIDVCIAQADGSAARCMGQAGMSNANPTWSADGSQIIFTSNRDGDWEIFSTSATELGTGTQLTNNEYNDLRPRVSADNKIVYDASPRGQYDIYTMNIDGSAQTQLTTDSTDDTSAEWLGDKIIFSSLRSLDGDIYMIDADGSNVTRLTNELGTDGEPTWCAIP